MANKQSSKFQPARQPRAMQPQSQPLDPQPGRRDATIAPTGKQVQAQVASGLTDGDGQAAEPEVPRGLKLEPYQVLLRPLVTEKNVHKSEKLNQYAFEVHSQATKTDIRAAVEAMFDVRVVSVRTQNRVGKPRRGKTRMTRTRPWKRAIVTLHETSRINFF